MRIIGKSDLAFIGDRLTDSDGIVVTSPALVHEVNELVELRTFVDFVKANAAAITASTESITFTMPRAEAPSFKTGRVAATPLLDEDKAGAAARALEFLDMQTVSTIDRHLERYPALAKFMAADHIVVGSDISAAEFLTNPLGMTANQVTNLVEEYHSPDIAKLCSLVTVNFS